MSPVRLLFLGIAAYAAFLVATIPASVVAPEAAALSRGRVTLANPAGTAWSGTARASLAFPGATIVLDEVRWTFLPSRLLAGRVAFAIEARAGSLRARAEASRSPLAWQLHDLAATGEASALAAAMPFASAWQPGGILAIEATRLEWDGQRAAGSASLEWRDAALALSAVRPLGSWRAEATGDGPAIRVAVSTLKGPLRVSGKGAVAIPGRLSFTGEARAEPARERDLEPVLDLVGPRRADGARAIEVR